MTTRQQELLKELRSRLDFAYTFFGKLPNGEDDSSENMNALINDLIHASESAVIDQVTEFYKSFRQPRATGINYNRAQLRMVLLQEEVDELDSALHAKDDTEAMDAIIDCMYILIGTALELGIAHKIPAAFAEVHRSNMTKLDENGEAIFREDGKIVKSALYEAPNITKILKS